MSKRSRLGATGRRLLGRLAALGGTAIIISSLLLTVGVTAVSAADTGAKLPTTTGDPSNGWTGTPANAFTDNGQYATVRPAAGASVSQSYGTFGFSVPNGSIVDGIRVRVQANATDAAGCTLDVRLSGNGGTTYQTKSVPITSTSDTVYTAGSASDTWGAVWDPTQLTDDNFRVTLRAVDGTNCDDGVPTNNEATFAVDYFDVTITYRTITQGTANPPLSANTCDAANFNFIIDMSGSIGQQGNIPSNLPDMIAGINKFVTDFQVSGNGKYAATRFNGSSATNLTNGYISAAAFKTIISNLSNPSGLTPTGTGIAAGQTNIANPGPGQQIMFVLTDGSPNVPNTHGDDLTNPETWLQGANAAIAAANTARNPFVVEAFYVTQDGPPPDPGDVNLPFTPAGDVRWAQAVMTEIGGGSFLVGDFDDFEQELAQAIHCTPDIRVLKTADNSPIPAGATAAYTIEARNIGKGTANGVTLTDNLPSGVAWSEDSTQCSIANGTLSCNFGTMAADAVKVVHLSGVTDAADCGTLPNTASASASNEPDNVLANNSASATITVQCGSITIIKNALPNDAQDFAFSTTGGAPLASFSLDDDGDNGNALSNTKVFNKVGPGAYTVTEAATTGWDLTNLVCNDANGSVSIPNRTATINLQPNENVTCTFTNTRQKNNPTISTVASAPITIGGSISDTATLAGGFNPTGTITYTLYGPNDATCALPAIFTTTKPVSGNGSYTSASFPPVAVGTYRWIASYGGDSNNNPVSGNCNDANESVVVSPATPGIATSAAESVVIGSAIHDTAVLSGAVGATGTITFNLYATGDCSGVPLISDTRTVAGNGSYGPVTFTPGAIGTYHWIASYGGDANNAPIAGACGDAGENDTVIKASPAIVTSANQSVVFGNPIADTATLSGGVSATGTINFNAYSTANCSGAAVFTTSLPVNGNGSYGPVGFTPAAVGTYHWIASYGGDGKNNAATGVCGAEGENDTVTPAAPSVVTQASGAVTIGGAISDTATLSGAVNPTGSITFNLYGPNDATCTGSVIFTSTVTVNANGAYGSGNFTPTIAGTYRWIANYGGDGNNAATANGCNGANESVVVNPAHPTVVTQASGALTIGSPISDTATLAGGVAPTGSLGFKLYGPNDATCSGPVIFQIAATVVGNGNYGAGSFTPTQTGTYRWIANYSGDANNTATANTCNESNESVVVNPATPTIATVATEGGVAGDPISDTATLSGAYLPTTGTMTFNLYSATDPGCEDDPIFTSTVSITAGGTATSAPFTVTLAGTYHWIASYSGDAHNEGVTGSCGDQGETTLINKFNPDITTSLSSGDVTGAKITVLFGASVTDQATLTGASPDAGGSVTYTVYSDNACTQTIADAGSKPVVAGAAAPSDPVVFPAAGTFYWQAAYSGDANNAPATSTCTDEVLTVTTPDLHTVKLVKTNDGSFGPTSTANPGDTLTFQITITNNGDADATNVPVSDDINAILAHATYNGDCSNGCNFVGGVLTWTIPTIAKSGGSVVLTFSVDLAATFPDGTTALPNVVVVEGPGSNCAAAEGASLAAIELAVDADCDTTTTVDAFSLVLDKTNDAPLEDLVLPDKTVVSLPTADEGKTVTYTLTYTVGALDVTNAVITDVVPEGLQYIDGSATSNAEFTFDGYDSTTRTLSWMAAKVTENGSVTYDALVVKGASELAQPLTNVASIGSDQTPPDDASSDVFVPVIPLSETAPPTDVSGHTQGTSAPGFSLMLILAVLGGLILVIGFVTPVPEVVRRRSRR